MTRVSRRHTAKTAEKTPAENILSQFRQWATLKHIVTADTTRMNLLRDKISAFVESNGEVDDKGSFFLMLAEPVTVGSKTYEVIKRERRVSTFFKEDDAEAWLTKNGLLEAATTTTTFLDQDKVYVLNQEGKIPDEVLDTFFGEKIAFAFTPGSS